MIGNRIDLISWLCITNYWSQHPADENWERSYVGYVLQIIGVNTQEQIRQIKRTVGYVLQIIGVNTVTKGQHLCRGVGYVLQIIGVNT